MIGMGHFKGKSTIKDFVLAYPLNRTPSLRLCTCWFRILGCVRVCAGLNCVRVGRILRLYTCLCRVEIVYLHVLVQVFKIAYMLAQDLGIVYVSVRD